MILARILVAVAGIGVGGGFIAMIAGVAGNNHEMGLGGAIAIALGLIALRGLA